jgi:hypothetical protein
MLRIGLITAGLLAAGPAFAWTSPWRGRTRRADANTGSRPRAGSRRSRPLGSPEGQGWRYEVIERPDDYLVRMRDLDTGALEESDSKLFRTAAVAFAYADLSAAFDRYAAARMVGEDVSELERPLTAQRALYEDISAQLGDEGMSAQMLMAWEHWAEVASRRRLH